VAIDPAIFGDKDAIIDKFSRYLQDIRSLPAVPGKTIYVAGDKEALAYEENRQLGIQIDDRTLEEVESIASRLNVDYAPYI
jgi:LDH2 family malate/lactate/ureidoglycolate dehydrogenase